MAGTQQQEISSIKQQYINLARIFYERAEQWQQIKLTAANKRNRQEAERREIECRRKAWDYERKAQKAG